MSEIIETYQQEQKQLGKPELPQMAFATVVSVNDDGLELRFDGETEASTKRFPCNVGVSFEADQRALLMKVNGSYVTLCPVGLNGGGGGGGGGGGASTWDELSGKPFSTIGDGLKVVNGALTVDGEDPSGDFYEIGGTIYYDAGSNGATYTFYDAEKRLVPNQTVSGLATAVYYKISGSFTRPRWYVFNEEAAAIQKPWGGPATRFLAYSTYGADNSALILGNYSSAFAGSIWEWLKNLREQRFNGFNDWFIPSTGNESNRLVASGLILSSAIFWTSYESSASEAMRYINNFNVGRPKSELNDVYAVRAI